MDAEIYKGLIAEAQSYLPAIQKGIGDFCLDSTALDGLKEAQKQLTTIKGAASMIGMSEISSSAEQLTKLLTEIISNPVLSGESQAELLFEKYSAIEMLLATKAEELAEITNHSDNLSEEDELFDFSDSNETSANLSESAESFDDFEIDDEMMEVFAIEAEDHLQNISTHLSNLEDNPNNRESILEIRRSSHTLKGSAGIVGLKKISALAHRMEDLLDYISDNEIAGDTNIFELLLASTDCLESLAKNYHSIELDAKIPEIYQRFNVLMASLNEKEAQQVSAVSEPPIVEESNTTSQVILAQSDSQLIEGESAETAENQVQIANNRSVIRVSIERLDDLVKLVSEMIITRSVFEQRIIELEQQVNELKLTNNRLRRSTNKLEVDFEARALGQPNLSQNLFSFHNQPNRLSAKKKAEEFDLLELDQYTEFHQTTRELIESAGDTNAIHDDLEYIVSNLGLLFYNQRQLIDEMQDNLLRLRMVVFNSIAPRLQRAIRVTASEEKKLVELKIENENIEVDTQILDAFIEPLIHILRNAVAHGIEPAETRKLLGKSPSGLITLKAYSEGTHIVFTISDDGRGISANALKEQAVQMKLISVEQAEKMSDEEAFSLIFLPGLSTAENVNEISGRGVGMNVVKSTISRRKGDIFINSKAQKGTTFTVRLPMSLAVTRILLVKSDGQTFGFPLKLVKQVVDITLGELEKAQQKDQFVRDGKSYKFFHFNDLLGSPISARNNNSRISLLLIETPHYSCALLVDQLIKPEEVVIKPLGNILKNVPEIIGATILGDGSVVPILDLINLIKRKRSTSVSRNIQPKPIKSEISVLIVDDSPSVRQVNSNLIKNTGWKPILAKDGLEALELLQNAQSLPDIILTDVEMPKMDGYELLAALKRQDAFSSIPVIMITSRSGEKHRRKALDLGVNEYLNKPFEEWLLIDHIKRLVKTTAQ